MAYVSLCDLASTFNSLFLAGSSENIFDSELNTKISDFPCISFSDVKLPLTIFVGKKYKPTCCTKSQPIETKLPSWFCIICKIKSNPLEYIPQLPTTGRKKTSSPIHVFAK
jgi:hypothetical protein